MRAPSADGELLPVAGRGHVDAVDLGLLRPHEPRLQLGIAGEIAGRQHHAAARPEAPRAVRRRAVDAANRPRSVTSAVARAPQTNLDAGAPRRPGQMRDEGARVGQHVVHARLAVRRLRHRPVEAHAVLEQPAECVRHLVGQQASQIGIVARIEFAVEAGHVAPMVSRIVDDALARLVRRLARGHRADRPGGRAAELRILLDQHDLAPGRARLDRGRQPTAAATDHDDVVDGLAYHGDCSARCPAVVPAILPNTGAVHQAGAAGIIEAENPPTSSPVANSPGIAAPSVSITRALESILSPPKVKVSPQVTA